ncbi:MAG: response regulator [Bacteroidales bacterium]|nr:response regulator [Bacteroidales bacterium]HPD96460.1 response regulator [Tenuifilaceae bacterium]HRX30726.1 response regulator [Tenuifilaceae bacterium]
MCQFTYTSKKVNVYVVEYSPEYLKLLESNFKLPLKVNFRSFVTGEKFINFITESKEWKHRLSVAFIGYNFFDEYNRTLMNGLEVLESVKKIAPSVEVVMMSNPNEVEYGGYIKKMGAYDYVLKDENLVDRAKNFVLMLSGNYAIRVYKKNVKVLLILWIISFAILLAAILYIFLF